MAVPSEIVVKGFASSGFSPDPQKSAQLFVDDLAKSGLEPVDLGWRPLGGAERLKCGVPGLDEGYIIQYFDIKGKIIPFYRAKLYGPIKYKQAKDQSNHLYFPRNFLTLVEGLAQEGELRYILLTEGEKKATKATKEGFPCVGLTGVDSWRNRKVVLPVDTEIKQDKDGRLKATITGSTSYDGQIKEDVSTTAIGFNELVALLLRYNIPLIIVFDNDAEQGPKEEVARAAATLGYELRYRGLPSRHIRYMVLETPTATTTSVPVRAGETASQSDAQGLGSNHNQLPIGADSTGKPTGELLRVLAQEASASEGLNFVGHTASNDELVFDMSKIEVPVDPLLISDAQGNMFKTMGVGKVGLDDYLVHPQFGVDALANIIEKNLSRRSAFPRHPNPREYINKKLQAAQHLNRAEYMSLAFAVLTDMDAKGARLRSDEGLFYFDYTSKQLFRVIFNETNANLAESPLARRLYEDYNISTGGDANFMRWFITMFANEEPLLNVAPKKVMTSNMGDGSFYLQISNSQIAKVPFPVPGKPYDGLTIIDNGEEDVLFESDHVLPTDASELLLAYEQLKKTYPNKLPNYWYEVLKEARISKSPNDQNRIMLSLLYMIAPWLFRWNWTQLPIEIMIGESGSGKSTLYILRQQVINGFPRLRNAPTEMKDWVASVTSSGALHVVDNLQLTDKMLRQRLSDEMCRLITEPDPVIEQRKLYTNNQLARFPVSVTFAVTAIQQPFNNVDIIQRSIVTKLDKVAEGELTYDVFWNEVQLARFGGRTKWLALHLLFLERLFVLASKKWKKRYLARYRLVNMEQLFALASEIIEIPGIQGTQEEVTKKTVDLIINSLSERRDESMVEADGTIGGLKAFVMYMADLYKENLHKMEWGTQEISQWAEGQEEHRKTYMLTNSRMLGKHMASHEHAIWTTTGLKPSRRYGNRQLFKIDETKIPQMTIDEGPKPLIGTTG